MNKKIYMIKNERTNELTFRSNLKKVFIYISQNGNVTIKQTVVKNYVSFWRQSIADNSIRATVKRKTETITFNIDLHRLL